MALPSPMAFPQVQQAPSVLSLQERAQEKVRQSECPATAVGGTDATCTSCGLTVRPRTPWSRPTLWPCHCGLSRQEDSQTKSWSPLMGHLPLVVNGTQDGFSVP